MKKVELIPADVSLDYLKKWQAEHHPNFKHLYIDGKKVSDTLYRVGGFGTDLEEPYFMILKYKEDHYDKEILKMSKNKNSKHLAGHWVILDNNGEEKVEFDQFASPYLHGILYTINSNWYNTETGELYAKSVYDVIHTDNFTFLGNRYDDDKSRRGVIQVNKVDGSFVIIN